MEQDNKEKMMKMASTTARMTIEVEVDCGSPWSDGSDLAQVRKQATESGLFNIRKIAEESNRTMRIIGKPQITVIFSVLDKGS